LTELATTNVHPDEVLVGLIARASRSDKKDNLRTVHEVCRTHHASGNKDFSLPVIGPKVEAAGALKAAALKTKQSQDYRELIAAWAAYAGPADPKQPTVPRGAMAEWMMKIPDPAARSLVQSVMVERDKLRHQVNTLKAHANITIDLRPKVVEVLAPASMLTSMEREALERAISAELLAKEGWSEGPRGEIVAASGRRVFDNGFATGLRKLLGK
jgi:hypothetical protein